MTQLEKDSLVAFKDNTHFQLKVAQVAYHENKKR